jgi:hypothetical protein
VTRRNESASVVVRDCCYSEFRIRENVAEEYFRLSKLQLCASLRVGGTPVRRSHFRFYFRLMPLDFRLIRQFPSSRKSRRGGQSSPVEPQREVEPGVVHVRRINGVRSTNTNGTYPGIIARGNAGFQAAIRIDKVTLGTVYG